LLKVIAGGGRCQHKFLRTGQNRRSRRDRANRVESTASTDFVKNFTFQGLTFLPLSREYLRTVNNRLESRVPEQHMVPDSSNRGPPGPSLGSAQVGREMVVPIGVGLMLDRRFGWAPWGVVVGAVLGLCLGLVRLVRLANKEDSPKPPSEKKSEGP